MERASTIHLYTSTTIPEKFVRSVGGQISELVKLETPDGNTYKVHVAKELNNLVLRSGWSIFASVYGLEEGDFLRFKYNRDSHFKVEIYDPSACEKESSCIITNCNPGLQTRSIPSGNPMSSPEDERIATRHNSCKTSKINPADSSPEKPTKKEAPSSEGIQDSVNLAEGQTSTRSPYFLAAGCNLTNAHKAEVDKIEQKASPEIPLYVKTMASTSPDDAFLVICKDYAIKYLPHEDEIITLCHASNSNTWGVHFKINADGTYHLSAGWPGFVQDNELQEGDICVFEVLKAQKSFTMVVHLLRASYDNPPGFATSTKKFRPEDKVMFSRFTPLKGLLKTRVYEKVETINSEIPIFVSVVLKSNIALSSSMLAFSLAYARDYLPNKSQTVRLHRPRESTPWKTSYRILHGRRWLVGGWRQFSYDNKLKLDDVCLFERMKNRKKLRMMVHIIRKEEYC